MHVRVICDYGSQKGTKIRYGTHTLNIPPVLDPFYLSSNKLSAEFIYFPFSTKRPLFLVF